MNHLLEGENNVCYVIKKGCYLKKKKKRYIGEKRYPERNVIFGADGCNATL